MSRWTGALCALVLVPLALAACGGSSGVAGPGRDAAAGDVAGEARDAAPETGDGGGGEPAPDVSGGADAQAERAADAPGDAADGRADGTDGLALEAGDGPTGDAPKDGDAAGNDAPSPADATGERGGDAAPPADAAAERVSMPCTAPGTCDPFDPAACGAQLCRVQLDGNTACVPAAATLKAAGAACAASSECGDGLDCAQLGDDPGFTCQRTCPRGSIGLCGGELRCTSFLVGCLQFCRPRDTPCDIYAQDCADPTRTCALSVDSETGERYTGCRPAGPGARGDRCDGVGCGKGLLCVRDGGVSTCRQVCTGDGGALPCTGGETCTGLTSTYQIPYCK
jgi:hypothetical protein